MATRMVTTNRRRQHTVSWGVARNRRWGILYLLSDMPCGLLQGLTCLIARRLHRCEHGRLVDHGSCRCAGADLVAVEPPADLARLQFDDAFSSSELGRSCVLKLCPGHPSAVISMQSSTTTGGGWAASNRAEYLQNTRHPKCCRATYCSDHQWDVKGVDSSLRGAFGGAWRRAPSHGELTLG